MFSQIDITLGDTLISQSNNTYPWTSFFEAKFCISSTSKFHFLKAAGYFRDKEATPDAPHETRYKMCELSKEFTLMGRLHNGIFQQNRLILNGTPMKVKLIRASDAFCLLADGLTPKLHLLDACLFVRKVKLNPALFAAQAKLLNEINAKYPIVRPDSKAISIPANQNIHVLDNIYLGKIPRRIICGLLDNDAHLGSYTKSPFRFLNHSINFLQVFINSDAYPSKPYTPDFSKDIFAREYFSLYDNMDMTSGGVIPLDIEFSEYKNNFCLFAFDFSPDKSNGCGSGSHLNIPKTGTLRIEIHFSVAPATPLKLIVFAEFDSIIEITKNREVLTDF
jgi:hypothetical protein